MTSRPLAIGFAVVACLLLLTVVPALADPPASPAPAAKEAGELWEITTQTTGMGLSMPPRTTRVCRPKTEWNDPPMADGDRDCEMLDVKSSPGKMSWSMRCKGDPPVTGTGEIAFNGRESYEGAMTMTMGQGEMRTKLSGRNLHQECDAGELKRQIAEIQQTSENNMKKMCEDAARSLALQYFDGPEPLCTAPEQKAEFCKNLGTMEGFVKLPTEPANPYSRDAAAKFCGTTPEKLLADLCPKALAGEVFDFLGKYCPAETRALAERECAGRRYTELNGSKYQRFCSTFAADMLASKPAETKPPEADKKDDVLDKAKKKLKGLFRR